MVLLLPSPPRPLSPNSLIFSIHQSNHNHDNNNNFILSSSIDSSFPSSHLSDPPPTHFPPRSVPPPPPLRRPAWLREFPGSSFFPVTSLCLARLSGFADWWRGWLVPCNLGAVRGIRVCFGGWLIWALGLGLMCLVDGSGAPIGGKDARLCMGGKVRTRFGGGGTCGLSPLSVQRC